MRVTEWDLINRKAIFGTVRDTALGPSAIDSNGGKFLFFSEAPTSGLAGSGTLPKKRIRWFSRLRQANI